jgi:hypothetical protein
MSKLSFIICLVLLISINSKAQQRYAIIDRKLKQPFRFADTITNEQLNNGYFAVEKQNIDTLVVKLQLLKDRLQRVAREHYDEVKWNIGSTQLTIKVVKWYFADRLNVSISTDTGQGYDHSIYIVDAKISNNDNARYLKRLIDYIDKQF